MAENCRLRPASLADIPALAALERVLTAPLPVLSKPDAPARVAEPLAGASGLERPSPASDETGPDAELLAAFQMEHREHVEAIRTFVAEAEAGRAPGAGLAARIRRRAPVPNPARSGGDRGRIKDQRPVRVFPAA